MTTEQTSTATEEVTTNTPEATTEAAAPADLSINDLAAMKMIIDVASSRGAFKPNEMTLVGQTYTKLTAFLDEVAKQQPAQAAGV